MLPAFHSRFLHFVYKFNPPATDNTINLQLDGWLVIVGTLPR
jgi:hypothetical protein